MRYTVIIEPTNEPEHPGWFYARIPSLDLVTHGFGVEGAMQAAKEAAEIWVAAKKQVGEPFPVESLQLVTQIEIEESAVQSA